MARDGVSIEVYGSEKIDQALKRLHYLSARKRDVTDVFRRSLKPLITAGKATAPMSSGGVRGSRYASRNHRAGQLRRSIKFLTSKRYVNVWYVRAGRTKQETTDAWYAHMVGKGTKRMKANPFMDRAWNSTGNQVIKDLEDGLMALGQRLWGLR